jgi:hypothetical protein
MPMGSDHGFVESVETIPIAPHNFSTPCRGKGDWSRRRKTNSREFRDELFILTAADFH